MLIKKGDVIIVTKSDPYGKCYKLGELGTILYRHSSRLFKSWYRIGFISSNDGLKRVSDNESYVHIDHMKVLKKRL